MADVSGAAISNEVTQLVTNLALSFLGLPPIPGSSIVSALNTLRVARFDQLTTLFWYDPNHDSVLEPAAVLNGPGAWRAVTHGLTLNETTRSYSVTNRAGGPQSCFRVQKL